MPLLNFKARFVAPIESGDKRQTIRARRKHPIKAGDTLYLYTGLRQKGARKLKETICTEVAEIEIHWEYVLVGGHRLSLHETNLFAQSDGFADAPDFYRFWVKEHGLSEEKPLKGFDLIKW